MDEMPKIIMTVVIAMLVLVVGTFAFLTVSVNIGYTKEQTETFSVEDPTVDQTLTLQYYVSTISSVYQYNGYEWVLVDPAYYNCVVKTLTVDHA